jgi:RNase H-fold protein (predicted Holliday junction resolvase)
MSPLAASTAPAAGGPVAALDPGRSKCGLVLSDPARSVIRQALVLPPESAWNHLQHWHREGPLSLVVIGDGTGSEPWRRRIEDLVAVAMVNERGTTLAARRRYWQLFPPRGWRRLLPEGLRHPSRDWDDVVAQLLLERWLGRPLPRDPSLVVPRLRTLPAP